jgi:hypothetical protein
VSEIFKQSEKFGENIFALVNLFKLQDNKVIHLIESLNNIESQAVKELYYENFFKFYEKVENLSKNKILPNEYDIFTNKFFSLKNIDLIFNIYCKDFIAEQLDLNKSNSYIYLVIRNLLFIANTFKVSHLLFPIDLLFEKVFKLNKGNDMKALIKHIKTFFSIIKTNMQLLIKSGV